MIKVKKVVKGRSDLIWDQDEPVEHEMWASKEATFCMGTAADNSEQNRRRMGLATKHLELDACFSVSHVISTSPVSFLPSYPYKQAEIHYQTESIRVCRETGVCGRADARSSYSYWPYDFSIIWLKRSFLMYIRRTEQPKACGRVQNSKGESSILNMPATGVGLEKRRSRMEI